jgi:hypothetical protein
MEATSSSDTARRFSHRIGLIALLVVSFGGGASLTGCGEGYCQSGPKYGTQCYDMNSIEWQETQVRGETVSERYAAGPSHPVSSPPLSPGCVVAGSPSSLYVASGACTSNRQPAYGAVR